MKRAMYFMTILFGLSLLNNLNAQEMYHSKIDTVYHAPADKEIFFYNGYEPPERTKPDFVLKENGDTKNFKIDQNCKTEDPKSCVSLYHFIGDRSDKAQKDSYKWIIRASDIAKDELEIIYGQKVGDDGNVVYSKTTLAPGEIKDMGYGKLAAEGNDVPKKRYVWIVGASWN